MTNPLLAPFDTNFALPPFSKITEAHITEAFDIGMREVADRIKALEADEAAPSFENTILILEELSPTLNRARAVFYNINGTDSTPARQDIASTYGAKFAALYASLTLSQPIFARLDALKSAIGTGVMDAEQERVVTLYHDDFVRSGAKLTGDDRTRYAEIMERLASLGTAFVQRLLGAEAAWSMTLSEADMEGLPVFLKDAAKSAAEERGEKGYVITTSRSLMTPFLQFSPRRDLREKAFAAWSGRGAEAGETYTLDIAAEMLTLRHERATLLGFKDFATYKLATEMAETPENVLGLLNDVWAPAKAKADEDAEILQKMLADDGINGPLQPWDWRYYSEKRRAAEFDLDEAEVKPYFSLDAMITASFACATKLFGLTFQEIEGDFYHADVRAWEVRKGDRHMGIFIGDYFARASKRSGAWCSSFRNQHKTDGDVRPHVVNVCNFAKASSGETLLNFDDARTLFHEFGHALHHLLSDVTYRHISGTSVARDFVELPSQLYEHWLTEPGVLKEHAIHVETGEALPDALLDKILAAGTYDMGFQTVEYLSSAFVDLAFHRGTPPADIMAAQEKVLSEIGMPAAITMRHASPHFAHVFAGDGYAAGYYSYMWSEVMDADAFAAFEETGDAFNAERANALETFIYSAGASRPPQELYQAFRGKMPSSEPLLKGRGLA